MNTRDEKFEIQALLAKAEDEIGTVGVRADLLKDFLVRLERTEVIFQKQMAHLRDTEEARDIQRAPGGFSTLHQIERTARGYMGAEFHNLEATCLLLKRLFAAVRDEDHVGAQHYVGSLDAGMDDRPWETEEERKERLTRKSAKPRAKKLRPRKKV
jgi:hypothetical protein